MELESVQTRKKEALESGKCLVDWVEEELRHQVTRQLNSRNTKFPREHALARSYNVSINTVRSALERLKKESLIRSVQGKGTFIVPSSKKTGVVLVIADNPYHPYKVMASGVMCSVLREAGFQVDLYMRPKPQEELDGIGWQENLRGAILLGAPSHEFIRRVQRQIDAPVVNVDDIGEEGLRVPAICDSVSQDNRAKTFIAAEYLIRAGHKRIAYCGWGLKRPYGREAVQGYRNAQETYHLDFHEDWIIEFPKVSFEQPNDAERYHRPLRDIQRQIDRWFASPETTPTALIHGAASELQIRDMNQYYFNNHFPPEAIVGTGHKEYLDLTYNGMGKATVVCMSFESLARRALELMLRPREKNSPPIREFQEQVFVYERNNGVWELQPPKNAL